MIRLALGVVLLLSVAVGSSVGQEGAQPEGDPEDQPYPLTDVVGEEPEEEQRAEPMSPVGLLVRIGLTLLGVIVLIMALGWAARKYVPGAQGLTNRGPLKVLARTPIAPRAHLYLVQVGKRLLVVGYTGDSMRTLCQIEEPGEVSRLLGSAGQVDDAGGGGFGGVFRRSVGEYGAEEDESEGEVDLDRVKEELKRLRE